MDNKLVWFLIVFFLGFLGIDKFLKGNILWGLLKLITLGFFGIGNLIEAILVLLDKYQTDVTKYFK